MINRRVLLAFAAALALSPEAHAQGANPRVRLETTAGAIVLELFADKAPVTAANYLKYVDRGLFDGATFYRASKPPGGGNDYGLVVGGLRSDPKKTLPPIPHEPTTKTGLSHVNGTISMSRFAPGTARADWFIVVGDQPDMDADPKAPKANPGFAAFGRVVEGLDVAQKILGMPVDPKSGTGVARGEMLARPVRILKARRS